MLRQIARLGFSLGTWAGMAALSFAPTAGRVKAQSVPTARQSLQLSAFGGASGVYTGLAGGRNLSITAGLDATLRPFFGISPGVEVRGTLPVDKGSVDSQSNVLAGVVLGKRFGALFPYVDFLYGRGRISYSPPYPDPAFAVYYIQTTSGVMSPGAGLAYDLSRHFGVRADVQYQRYVTPVTISGHLYATPITLAVVYHLDFNRTPHLPNR